MWAFSITHNRPLGRADWAFILDWRQRPGCFDGRTSSLGLASGPASHFSDPITFDAYFSLIDHNNSYYYYMINYF